MRPGASLNYRYNSYNAFVREFEYVLGLGEPGFDERYDQSDTAMSFN